jgi:hypothetical protein
MRRGEPALAIECKSGNESLSDAARQAFKSKFPKTPLVVASLKDKAKRRLASGIEILPWRDALEAYGDL